jgi:hypothetical protein
MGVSKVNHDEVLNQALNVACQYVHIPPQYKMIIRDLIVGEDRSTALFFWVHPENEQEYIDVEIQVTADEYRLIHFDFEARADACNRARENPIPLSLQQRIQCAKTFLEHYEPAFLETFTNCKIEEGEQLLHLAFSQEAGGIPLPQTGCTIAVDPFGNVIKFRYYGKTQSLPDLPNSRISEQEAKERFLSCLEMELMYADLSSGIYETNDCLSDPYQLVYHVHLPTFLSAQSGMVVYPKVTDEPEDVQQPNETWTPVTEHIHFDVPKLELHEILETFLGIREKGYKRIRDVDLGESIRVEYRRSDLEPVQEDRSLDGFFKVRTHGTVKIEIDKQTKRLTGLMNFTPESGKYDLSNEECFQIALQFLNCVIPEMIPHLYLVASGEEEESQNDEDLKHFRFSMRVQNIPVYMGDVFVSVNRSSGFIVQYSGPNTFYIPGVNERKPVFTKEDVHAILSHDMHVVLEWLQHGSSDQDRTYELVYRRFFPNGEIRFLDAETGTPIREKRLLLR